MGSGIETVKKFYDLFAQGKLEEMIELVSDDFVVTNPLPEPIPFGGAHKGPREYLAYVKKIADVVEIEEFVVESFVSEGNRVVVFGRERARVKATNRHYVMEWVHLFELEGDRMLSQREYNDTAEMRAAFV